MSLNSGITGDVLSSLPVDETVPNHNEIQVLETLFKEKHSGISRILENTKDVLIVGILFIFFSLDQVDEIIHKIFPSSKNSPYITLGIKTLAFMLLYFVIKNWYLSRKT